jgi:hypothetical protein
MSKQYKTYRSTIENNLVNENKNYNKAFEFAKKGQTDKMIVFLEKSIKDNFKPAFQALANYYELINNYELMEEVYKKGIESGCNICINLLASYYEKTNQKDKMIETFQIGVSRMCTMSMYNLASYFFDMKKFDETEKLLKTAVDLGHIRSINELAMFYKKIGNIDDMFKILKIGYEKKDPICKYNLALEYYLQDDYDNFNKYLNLDSNTNIKMFLLKMIYYQKIKDNEQIEKLLDETTNLDKLFRYLKSIYYTVVKQNLGLSIKMYESVYEKDKNLPDDDYDDIRSQILVSAQKIESKIFNTIHSNGCKLVEKKNFTCPYTKLKSDICMKTACCKKNMSLNIILTSNCPNCSKKFENKLVFDVEDNNFVESKGFKYYMVYSIIKASVVPSDTEFNSLTAKKLITEIIDDEIILDD